MLKKEKKRAAEAGKMESTGTMPPVKSSTATNSGMVS